MFFNLQQPAVWIVAVVALAAIGGVGVWLRRRRAGSAEAAQAASPYQQASNELASGSSLANIATTPEAHSSADSPQAGSVVEARPAVTTSADQSPADPRADVEASRPKRSTPAKKASRKKPAPKKTSPKKTARKK